MSTFQKHDIQPKKRKSNFRRAWNLLRHIVLWTYVHVRYFPTWLRDRCPRFAICRRTSTLWHRTKTTVRSLFRFILIHGGKRLLWLLTIRGRSGPVRRSLWAGTPILTLPIKAKAERLLGVQAETLVYHSYFITHTFDYNLKKWAYRGPLWWRKLFPYLVLIWACLRYQRFHFFCDNGLLPQTGRLQFNDHELQLYQYLGKEVYFYTYGADIRTEKRTRALGEPNCCTECPTPGAACVCNDEEGENNYARLQKYATAIFSMGDMIEHTPGAQTDLFYWPVDLGADNGRRYAPRYPNPSSTHPLRVVHAPNHRGFKGSHYLIDAVERLQKEGLPIELKLVEKVPNLQALEIYRTADIVFDQCLIGFHGYFALEAMAMGKPVMAFIRDPQRYLLAPEECPLINISPSFIEQALRELIKDRHRLAELGRRGRTYMEKHYTVTAFSQRLEQAIQRVYHPPILTLPVVKEYRAAA